MGDMGDILTQWKNKKVAVLGAGIEGMSTVRFLVKQGIVPVVLDEIELPDKGILGELGRLGVELHASPDAFGELSKFDVIFRSPGISPARKELQDASQKGGVV